MLTITRYAVAGDNTDPERPPLREVATWSPLPEDSTDPRAVEIDGAPGLWLLESCQEPLVDLLSQHTEAVIDRFGQIVDLGGQLKPGGTKDLYRLPLRDGYELVSEDEYVKAWNAVCAMEQRIPEVAA